MLALGYTPPQWSLSDAVQKFLEGDFADGDMLTHAWLQWALCIPSPRSISEVMAVQWLTLERVESFKRAMLLDHRVLLANVRGEGYRIVPPSEQARYAVENALDAMEREVGRSSMVLRQTRVEVLDNRERKRHTDATVKMGALTDMLRHRKSDVFALFGNNVKKVG